MSHEPLIVLAQFDKKDFAPDGIHNLLEKSKLDDVAEESDFYDLVPIRYDYVSEYKTEEERDEHMDTVYKDFIEESFRDGTPLFKSVGDSSDRIFTLNGSIAKRFMRENVERAAEALKEGKLTSSLYNRLFNVIWDPTIAICQVDKKGIYWSNPFGGPYTTHRKNFIMTDAYEGAYYCVIDAFDTHW